MPLGTIAELDAIGVHITGSMNMGETNATTVGLIFIAATNDHHCRAFEVKTGKMLWDTRLEMGSYATPITYRARNGKQYVLMVATGEASMTGREASAWRPSPRLEAWRWGCGCRTRRDWRARGARSGGGRCWAIRRCCRESREESPIAWAVCGRADAGAQSEVTPVRAARVRAKPEALAVDTRWAVMRRAVNPAP